LVGERIERGRWDAWIERENGASQSRLDLLQAVPTSTTGSICNGRRTIAVGAYDARSIARRLVGFSSCGPTRDGRRKPDLVAPGAAILAARSTAVSAGVRLRDATTAKSGTSMAAPHVCGTVALMFAAALPHRLAIDETRELLFSTLRPAPPTDPITRMRYGRGLLDAEAAVTAAVSYTHGSIDTETKNDEVSDDGRGSQRRTALGR
jgi:subtilisin family serine protease